MILGFAHLAVNVADMEAAETYWRTKSYARTALYFDTPNHPFKQRFLSNYQQLHDLMLLSGSGLWPIELTKHGPTHSVNTQLEWNQDAIQVTVPDPAPLQRLLVNGLGFCADNDDLVLNSRLPAWSCRLRLVAGDSLPTSLEATGPSCLAFYCNRIADDAQTLIGLGATDYTNEFELTLGERDMTIAMLRAPGGPLLELINPRKKK
jgi:hypothetical protein